MDINSISDTQRYRKRFNSIFVIEMMERFGFYAFNVIIVMFFVSQFHLPKSTAYDLFGAFSALLYIFIPIGGWVGDNYLGTKRTIIVGGIFLLVGYLVLASSLNLNIVFFGMGLIVVGNGLFKSNPASLLSKIVERGSISQRDSAYSMYYMAINIGSTVSEIISPIVAYKYGWQYGFGIAGLGLIIGVTNFWIGKKYFKTIHSKAGGEKLKASKLIITIVVSLLVSAVCAFLLNYVDFTKYLMLVLVIVGCLGFLFLGLKQKAGDRGKMVSALILIIMAIVFFSLYNQMFTSLTFFGVTNSYHNIFGIPVNPLQFQVINPVVIIIFAPILAAIYKWQGKKNKDMKITTKFTYGLLISAFAFLVLVPSVHFANAAGVVSSDWIVAAFFLLSIGELLVSALGASMISQLVPEKLMGFAIGMWYLSLAMAGVTGAIVANLTQPNPAPTTALQSLTVYSHAFLMIGVMTLCATVIMFIVKLLIDRYIYSGNKLI